MKERPILFSGEMVRALLDGTKTQTRRAIKFPARMIDDGQLPQIYHGFGFGDWPKGVGHEFYVAGKGNAVLECPYGARCDKLWVRETWANGAKQKETDPLIPRNGGDARWAFKADYDNYLGPLKWTPAIHMPRWASRITLDVTGVRVERLAEISIADCIAEGVPQTWGEWGGNPPKWAEASIGEGFGSPGTHLWDNRTSRENFALLWDSLAKPSFAWKDNPWVWAIEFKLITPLESNFTDAMIAAGREG